LIVLVASAEAKELIQLPAVVPSENFEAAKVEALIVKADKSKDLLTLTVVPVDPSALTYTLTVLSRAMLLKTPSALFALDEN
jgi:hypothetical protein